MQDLVHVPDGAETKRFATVGIVLTSIWIGGWLLVLFCFLPDKFSGLELNAKGDTIAGIVAPIGLLWLVLGYMQQGAELKQNTLALMLQVKQLDLALIEQRQLVSSAAEQARQASLKLVQEREFAELNARPRFSFQVMTLISFKEFHLAAFNVGAPASRGQVLQCSSHVIANI